MPDLFFGGSKTTSLQWLGRDEKAIPTGATDKVTFRQFPRLTGRAGLEEPAQRTRQAGGKYASSGKPPKEQGRDDGGKFTSIGEPGRPPHGHFPGEKPKKFLWYFQKRKFMFPLIIKIDNQHA